MHNRISTLEEGIRAESLRKHELTQAIEAKNREIRDAADTIPKVGSMVFYG